MKPGTPMREDVYALVSLDGAPLDPADLEVMGLEERGEGSPVAANGFMARVYEPLVAAIDIRKSAGVTDNFSAFWTKWKM